LAVLAHQAHARLMTTIPVNTGSGMPFYALIAPQ
jgi:hypothetical protein